MEILVRTPENIEYLVNALQIDSKAYQVALKHKDAVFEEAKRLYDVLTARYPDEEVVMISRIDPTTEFDGYGRVWVMDIIVEPHDSRRFVFLHVDEWSGEIRAEVSTKLLRELGGETF